MGRSPKKPITKQLWFWPVIGLFAIGAIAGMGDNEAQEKLPVKPDKSIVQADASSRSYLPDVSDSVEDAKNSTLISENYSSNENDTSDPEEVEAPDTEPATQNETEQNMGHQETQTPDQDAETDRNIVPQPDLGPDLERNPEPKPDPNPESVITPEPAKNTNAAGKDRRSNWANGAYLGSKESTKYHDYECRAAKNILPENEIWFSSEEDAQASGYSRCGNCWK